MTRKTVTGFAILGAALLVSPALQAADPAHVEAYKSGAGRCQVDVPCDLSGADLSGLRRNFIDMNGANASGTDFSESRMSNLKIVRANLSGANLSSTSWLGGTVQQSNLTGANLQGMVGKHGFSFSHNILKNANLTGAKIQGLDDPNYENKLCNTTMPDGSVSNRDC